MIINTIGMLAMGAPPGTQSTAPGWVQFFPIILMFVVFYFLLIRPQSKRQKEVEKMQKSLKGGMKVLTSSGIIGTIITVKEKSVTLRSADAKLELTRGAISEILERGEEEEAEPSAPPVKK
jgi:preprotein translocase subunit YajC